MASRDHQHHDNLFDSTPARSQPRASSQAPVLFGLPNLQKVEPQERRTPTPPPAVASQASIAPQVTPKSESFAKSILSNPSAHKTTSPTVSPVSTNAQVSSSSPSYQAVPESKPAERKELPKPFLGNWGNRLIVLSALIIIVLYGWKMMPNVQRDVATEALKKEGIAESKLETDIEMPVAFDSKDASQPTAKKSGENEVPRVAQAPSTPPFNIIGGKATEPTSPSTQISLETPSAQQAPRAAAGSIEENSSFKLDGGSDSFNLGSGTDGDDAWMNPPKLGQNSSSSSEVDAPQFVNSPNAGSTDDHSFLVQDNTNTTSPLATSPTITETEFANLSIEELYAARNRMMAERAMRNGAAMNPAPQFQTASTQTQLQRTPLQGQAYPANTSTPNRVVVPNSGQVGPALRPYQPVGNQPSFTNQPNNQPTNQPLGYGVPSNGYPLPNNPSVQPQAAPAGAPSYPMPSNMPPPNPTSNSQTAIPYQPVSFQSGGGSMGNQPSPTAPSAGAPNSFTNRLNPNGTLPMGGPAMGAGAPPAPKVVLPPYTPVGLDPGVANGPTAPTPMPNRQ